MWEWNQNLRDERILRTRILVGQANQCSVILDVGCGRGRWEEKRPGSGQREAGDGGVKLESARCMRQGVQRLPRGGGECARARKFVFLGFIRGRRLPGWQAGRQAGRPCSMEVGRTAKKGSTIINDTTHREGSRGGHNGKRGCRAGAPSSSVTNRPNGPGDRMIFARGCASQVGGFSHHHKPPPIEAPQKKQWGVMLWGPGGKKGSEDGLPIPVPMFHRNLRRSLGPIDSLINQLPRYLSRPAMPTER